jgi:hypothetical protein
MGLQAARLHSRYNPQAEADRYIDALNLTGGIEYFILIEPGLGYLITALKSRFNGSRIIVLHADNHFRTNVPAAETPDIPVWYPDSGETVQSFLEALIPDIGAGAARIIEWRPSLRLYGETCLGLVSETAAFIKRADASRRTAAAFGRRWINNCFRNLRLVQRALMFKPMDAPLIITGSGPGLESALPHILAMQGRAFILAASSSLAALAEGGIEPDMVISTDGGSWAQPHLYTRFRAAAPPAAGRLALALYAALPSQCADIPFLVLNDGSLWQRVILNALGVPSVIIPQRGTVTASALELALVLSSGPIYLAGMDLAIRDIRTHVRPYGFDHLFYGTASRLRPVYSQCFVRSAAMRQGGSHAVYAAWFKNQLAVWPRRIFSMGENHAIFNHSAPDNAPRAAAAWRGYFIETAISGRRGKAAEALIRAMDEPRCSAILRDELAPLLFPDAAGAAVREIQETIRGMAAKGANRG